MRRPFVAGNWKMHKTLDEACELLADIRAGLSRGGKVDVAVCPPFTLLHSVRSELQGTDIKLGAQNCYRESEGAFTGEVAPPMLVDAGCSWVIIGHSERRHIFGEAGDLLHGKVRAAMAAGLYVIYCLGETLDQREAGQTEAVVEHQLTEVMGDDLDPDRIVLAYEPVWAIGTGRNATPEQAQEVHAFLRGKLAGLWGQRTSDNSRILYGGSVKPENAPGLMGCPDVDGGLIGGACLKAESFLAIVGAAADSL
jgi:triosephosphate isomerase